MVNVTFWPKCGRPSVEFMRTSLTLAPPPPPVPLPANAGETTTRRTAATTAKMAKRSGGFAVTWHDLLFLHLGALQNDPVRFAADETLIDFCGGASNPPKSDAPFRRNLRLAF